MERDRLFSNTSARAHDSPALFCGRRFRLILHGADACVRARRARARGQQIWNSYYSERGGRIIWRVDRGRLWASGEPAQTCLGGVYSFSIAMTAFAFARNFYPALAFLFLAGFGMLLFFATSNTTLQTIVPDEMRGRVMGVWSLIFGAMIPLGRLEAGAVAHSWGTPFALGFGAIICLVAAIVTRISIARREAAAST